MSFTMRGDPAYACRCLNVRLYTHKIRGHGTKESLDGDWKKVFVGEDGIQITHCYMTLRTRSEVKPSADKPTEARQHTLITCLACRTPVYRTTIKLPWPSDEGLNEGPVVPNDEWLETEILKSTDGWVEVNLSSPGCLNDVSMANVEDSPRYSKTFGLLMPEEVASIQAQQVLTHIVPDRVLPPLPPLIPPPPAAPSHPMFQHLSMLATATSDAARVQAEEELSSLMKRRVEELQRLDLTLRREVELLWTSWKETRNSVSSAKSEAETRELAAAAANNRRLSRVTDFVPSEEIETSRPPSAFIPRQSSSVSLLSVSLARPSMMSRPNGDFPMIPAESGSTEQSGPATPEEVSEEAEVAGAIPMASWRKLTGQSHLEDVALSLKLSRMESAELRGRAAGRSRLSSIDEATGSGPIRSTERGRVGVEEVAAAKEQERETSESTERTSPDRTPKGESKPDDARSKHVKFDDIEQPHQEKKGKKTKNSKSAPVPALEGVEPMFDFDDDEPAKPPPMTEGYEPLLVGDKSPRSPRSPTSPRLGMFAQAGSYFSIGPGSLVNADSAPPPPPAAPSLIPGPEEKLRELVAGHTPSHRAIWKNGKGWDHYTRYAEEKPPSGDIEEEDEDVQQSPSNSSKRPSASRPTVPASAPIDISPLAGRGRYSSLRYDVEREPKTSLSDRQGILVPPLRAAPKRTPSALVSSPSTPSRKSSASRTDNPSSSARRKASYAARDLYTNIDPGPIFELGGTVEEEEVEDIEGLSTSEKGRRMVQHNDDLPDAGMWRSMAE